MPGKPWTTDDQAQFLKDQLPQYYEMQSNGTLSSFWPRLDREWFQAFPERAVAFPGCDELTAEQEEILKSKLDERRKASCIIIHH
jgi:hypothetical protein